MLVGTTNLNTTLNLTYVLADVVETLLLDMRSEMKKQGYDLRHDAKHNFNTAIAAIRRVEIRCRQDPAFYSGELRKRLRLSPCLHQAADRSLW